MAAVLLGVLGVVLAAVAFGASGPATPTFTAPLPPALTNGSPKFYFTGAPAGGSYQCSLDGSSFAGCTSPKAYTGLASGSHTFQVKAVDNKGKASDPLSKTWTVDATAPVASSIVRVGSSPTNAASVAWTVTISENVTGVSLSVFSLNPTVAGASLISVTGSGSVYTVSAGTGTGEGTLTLRLSTATGIKDVVLNTLGGSIPFIGQPFTIDRTAPGAPTITSGPVASPAWTTTTSALFGFSGETGATFQCRVDTAAFAACQSGVSYTVGQGLHTFEVKQTDAAGNPGTLVASRTWKVDSIAPPAPVLTYMPDDPNGDGIANFEWTDAESGLTFTCQIENFAFEPCSSPSQKIVAVNNDQQHQFVVRASDAAGNTSETTYRWKVDQAVRLTITGNAVGLLYPGASSVPIAVVFHNPNNFPIYVNALDVTVTGGPGCAVDNFAIVAADINATDKRVLVPSNDTSGFQTSPDRRPRIGMVNKAFAQNNPSSTTGYNCANKPIGLDFYSSSVTK